MRKTLLAVLLVLTVVVGCAPAEEPLTFCVIPADDPAATRHKFAPMIEYLEAGTGREVELFIVSDYTAVIEALRGGHVDVARISSVGYVVALEEGIEIEPIAKAVKEDTGLPGYYGYIVARADREWGDDVTGRSFAFVDVVSTSGYVVPSVWLDKEGIELGEVFMAGSHPAVILAVKNGTVEAGAIASNRYEAALAEGIITPGELDVLWKSDLIPNVPIVVQQDMDAELKAALKELFLSMPGEIVEHCGIKELDYVEASDGDYDPIREIRAYTDG